MSEVTVGTELPTFTQKAELATSIAYAAASGDLNPLHWDPAFAANVSPTGGVIAHGMYAMGLASRLVTSWAGDPAKVAEVRVRFTKPWPLGETATFGGTVTAVEGGIATVEVWATREDGEATVKGTARVRL